MTRNFLFTLLLAFIISPLFAKTILILGDSLSAAHGFEEKHSWVSLLGARLKDEPGGYKVVNLSSSGDTTSNGLAKLTHALSTQKPAIVIIELGANDGLRGLSTQRMQQNLDKMIQLSEENSAKVLLLATHLPPNYGPAYMERFNQVYQDLAIKYKLLLVPMFLEGVAGDPQFTQSDGLHPNQQAQQRIFENIWLALRTLL
jgi:acyl-CoA thioesterase I